MVIYVFGNYRYGIGKFGIIWRWQKGDHYTLWERVAHIGY